MKKTGVANSDLCEAVSEMKQGLVDAELGRHLLKKRIGLRGRGKRGGARTIVASKTLGQWFFLYGFNKNERSNLNKEEVRSLQELAKELLSFSYIQLGIAHQAGLIEEIIDDKNQSH